jgi:hypothetical protein
LGHPLAHFHNGGRLLVSPDYEKDPEQVYLELSKVLLQQIGPRVLTTVEHTPSTILGELPSWATRWDISLVMNNIFQATPREYDASAGLEADHPLTIVGNSLILRGIILDRIQKSFQINLIGEMGIGFEDTSTGDVIYFENLLEELRKTDDSPNVYVDRVDAFCRTICVGVSGLNGSHCRYAANLARYFEERRGSLKGSYHPQGQREDALVYYSKVRSVCMNRSFIVTEGGYFGLAPLLTNPGDISCILIGVDVPFILRPYIEGVQFRLLGESYIHGVMKGQVKGRVDRGEVFRQTVVIC